MATLPLIKRQQGPSAVVIFSILLFIFAVHAPGSVAQDDTEATESSRPTDAPMNPVAVEDIVDDGAIAQRLQRIYQASGWFTELTVQSDSGIVIISGSTDSEEHHEWASRVAQLTEGVIAVINKTEVEQAIDLANSAEVVESSLDGLWKDALVRSPLILAALLILAVVSLIAKFSVWLLGRVLENRPLRSSLKDLIYQLTSIAIWVVGLLAAAVVAFPGMTPSRALTVLGLGSVAIGFAFKDIFENFFAGMLILWRYPFDRGDFIACGDLTGQVTQITIRNTLIRKLDGELAVVPNGHLFKNNVDVLTNQPQRRVRIICGVAYGEDIDTSREVILKAVQSCESVQGIRTVEVFAKEFASSSVNFEVAWWTGSKPIDIRRSRDEVVAAIKSALDNAGIEIPFPYRTLTFKDDEIEKSVKATIGQTSQTHPVVNEPN